MRPHHFLITVLTLTLTARPKTPPPPNPGPPSDGRVMQAKFINLEGIEVGAATSARLR